MNLRAKETEECQIQIELVSCLFVYFQVTSPMQWRFSIQTTSTNGTKGWMATPTDRWTDTPCIESLVTTKKQ